MRATILWAVEELEKLQASDPRAAADGIRTLEGVLARLRQAVEGRPMVRANAASIPGGRLVTAPPAGVPLAIRRAHLDSDRLGYALVGAVTGVTYAEADRPAALLRYARSLEAEVQCLFALHELDVDASGRVLR